MDSAPNETHPRPVVRVRYNVGDRHIRKFHYDFYTKSFTFMTHFGYIAGAFAAAGEGGGSRACTGASPAAQKEDAFRPLNPNIFL